MSILHMSAPEVCGSIETSEGPLVGLVGGLAASLRERRRRRALRELLALDDAILDDIGISRNELAPVSRPRLPADVLAWLGRRR